MILLPGGRVFFVELKASNGRATPMQLARIEQLCALGFDARVVTGPIELEELLDEFGAHHLRLPVPGS